MKAIALAVIRHLLTTGGGLLAARGLSNQNEVEQAVSAAMVLAGIIWSICEKAKLSKTAAKVAVVAIASAAIGGGCATTPQDVEMARIASGTAVAYYNQPVKADYMVLEGDNVEWTIRGCKRVTFSGPIPAKSIYPREEGQLKQVIDGATDLAKTAALGIVGYQGVKALRAQKPTVVTTEKLVPVEGAVVEGAVP